MFKPINCLLATLAVCAMALVLASSPAQAQVTASEQQGEEIEATGDYAYALIRSRVENFELTGLEVRCGREWIDLQDGSLDEETSMRILEWSEWLSASGPDFVHITSTTASLDFEHLKDVIEAIESFSGPKAEAFCNFLRDLGVIGL